VGKYFLGNPIVADNPELKIEVLQYSPNGVVVTVHNPTKSEIRATVSANKLISKSVDFKRDIKLKAGDTIEISGKISKL
jgi:hypothetical protein